MDTPVLQLTGIDKSFSNVTVLKDINLAIRKEGTILGLVGENGAGKSTMMNVLGGVLPRDGGEMFVHGKPYNPKSAKDADEAGIAFIHQELNLFLNMTIAENIYLGGAPGSRLGFLSYRTMNREAKKLLKKLGLELEPTARIEDLSMGMRQMVEIVKALSKNARIVVFDEPTTSLSSVEKDHLFAIIKDLASKGISMIYISHTLDDILGLCHDVLVIRDGIVVGQSSVEETDKAKMIAMMVGRKIEHLFPYVEKEPGGEALRLENLSQGTKFRRVSFGIKSGEIVGMFGLMGAGRSELARAIFGLDPMDSGRIHLNGQPVHDPSPEWWIEHGMAFITENRREEGLLMPKSIKNNLVLANLRNMRLRFGAMDTRKEDADSDSVIEKLMINTFDKSRQESRMLSGGNQQKVVIGKWLLTDPRIFIIDEPTRGVDVGAKFEIYNHINALAKAGSAILFISSEMEELIGVCDRIIVMCAGELAGELARKDFNQEELLRLAIRSIKNDYISA